MMSRPELEDVLRSALRIELPGFGEREIDRLTAALAVRVSARAAQLEPPLTRESLLEALEVERRRPIPPRPPRAPDDLDSPLTLAARRVWLETLGEADGAP